MSNDTAGAFKTTYAELYDRHLVPPLFGPYARIIADRAKILGPHNIPEIAAATGIVTRELTQSLPPGVVITATDLNQPMIDRAIEPRDGKRHLAASRRNAVAVSRRQL